MANKFELGRSVENYPLVVLQDDKQAKLG